MTLKSGQRSLKVIGTNTYWSAMCDFLLTLHSNHGPISHHFQDRWQFQLKIAKFFPPAYILYPPLKGFPLELGISARGQKTRIMGLPGRTRSLTISLAAWIQYTNVTDGRTPGDSKDCTYA